MRFRDFGITVESLLAFRPPAQMHLEGGLQGLGRIITSVRVLEHGERVSTAVNGELYLAEAMPCGRAEQMEDVVEELNAAGAAGLGVKAGSESLPENAVNRANALHFPLFNIPDETDTQDVVNNVLTRVLNSQAQILDKIQDLNRALTSTMLHGGNLQEISKILYQRFGNSVAIVSDFLSSYVLNTTAEKRPVLSELLEEEKRNAFLGKTPPVTEVARVEDCFSGRPCIRIVVPIYSDSVLYGRIYMWQDFRPISGVEQSVLESATSLIALDMMKKVSVLHMENTNRGGFLAGLLSGSHSQFQKAMSSARYFDFNQRAGHRVMVIRLRSQNKEAEAYNFNTSIIRMLQQTVRGTVAKIIYANQGSQIIILLETAPYNTETQEHLVESFIASLNEKFARENVQDLLVIGVGREYLDPAELHKSFAEAKRAVTSPVEPQNGAIYFNDIGIYRFLCHESVKSEAECFCDEMLGTILAYDRDKDGRLLETLKTYFECSGNLSRLAEMLDIHYNTASNRLQRIQELAGIRLDNADTALNLQVAIKIYEMSRDEVFNRE